MAKEDTKGITVKKEEDMPEWYGQVCLKAKLADHSPIKGCMIIRPRGFALWQSIVDKFNSMLQEDNVENAYFPLFIPESFFKKEADHAQGFKPEVAWVATKDESGERLALRPTSETIIHDSFSTWIRSWRDLPIKINQWSNTIRWEVQDTKLFLRTREFLWQEGHCAYETREERDEQTAHFLERYRQVAEDLLAIPVMLGKKSKSETFPGADTTYSIESLMPDGKSLQMGTTHNLSQGFPKSFGINFQDRDGESQHPYLNSWGISTRMIGALVMTHGDDKGLVIPPHAAKQKIAIVPIIFDKSKDEVIKAAQAIGKKLSKFNPIVDTREEYTSGWKFNEYELSGVPLRLEIGPKDIEKEQVVIVRRDTREKEFVAQAKVVARVEELLETIQADLYKKAKERVLEMTVEANDFKEFELAIKERKMVFSWHCADEECELAIKEKTAATTRNIPDLKEGSGKCIHCQKEGQYKVYFARAY